jgi:hypothetical protein
MRGWLGCGVVFGSLAVTFVSCAQHKGSAPSTQTAMPTVTTSGGPSAAAYLFVPITERYLDQQPLEGGQVAAIVDAPEGGSAREIVEPDGSVSRAPTRSETSLMGGVPVPKRLGGGFLFWDSDTLYRARTFVAALEPVTRIPSNAIGVELGHDSILVFSPEEFPKAYSLEPAAQVPRSPHGVIDLAGADDDRVVALDATGRALASIDGGRTWKGVDSVLGGRVLGVLEEGNEIGFHLKEDLAGWLQRDGTFERRPFSERAARKNAPRTGLEPLTTAVQRGLPLSAERVLVPDGPGLAVLDLKTRTLSEAKAVGPVGSNCSPLMSGEEGLALCVSYGNQGASSVVVARALGVAPRTEHTFVGTPGFAVDEGLLVMNARCSGPPVDGIACVRTSSGVWSELDLRAQLADRQLLFWLVKEGGGVAALAVDADPTTQRVALLDAERESPSIWDSTPAQLKLPRLESGWRGSWRVDRDGTLRGFTSTAAITVDAHGHVSASTRSFDSVASARDHALARDSDDRLWQTTDYGAHWSEVAPPPAGYLPEVKAPKGSRLVTSNTGQMSCSLVGCSLPHLSGAGTWLRLGWPNDPPRARARPNPAAQPTAAATPLVKPPAPPAARLPALRCAPRGNVRELLTTKADAEGWASSLAGRRLPRARPRAAKITFGDVFSVTDTFVIHGRRAISQVETPARVDQGDFVSLIRSKARFELLFVEPFDPGARALTASGSFAGWPLPARSDGYNDTGSARPVLSSEAGHADGVLLVDGDLSLWAPRAGKPRRLPPDCSAESGYVDAQGKLFVACGSHHGATRIEDVEAGHKVLELSSANLFRDHRRYGMSFFPPGEAVFVNPDAIAVAPDGRLAILRPASGTEPATIDNPAWLLAEHEAPIELAPWSSLELATSPACAGGGGYRALVQTRRSWLEAQGSTAVGNSPGMSAIVRWSTERVCLEAVEVSFRSEAKAPVPVRAIARFVGKDAGATLLGGSSGSWQQAATCELVAEARAK